MPRHSPEARHIGVRLSRFFSAQAATQVSVGQRYGVTQTQIARIFDGDFSERSSTARRMCADAAIPFFDRPADEDAYQRNRNFLMRLVEQVWTGTDEDALFMAETLQAIGKLRRNIKPSSR